MRIVPTYRPRPAAGCRFFCIAWIVCFSAFTTTAHCSIIKYSIPSNAIKVSEQDLAAEQLTPNLIVLMGNTTTYADSKHLQDEEIREEIDPYDVPLALSRLNALLAAAEERKQKLESTSARILSINRGGFFRGLLVVWVPVSFLLPTLAHDTTYYRSGRSTWGGQQLDPKISSTRKNEKYSTSVASKITSYDANSIDYKFDPIYGPLLSRLEAYFGLLKINDVTCRWKLLCHISKTPDDYKPVSNLFQSLFERSQSHRKPEHYHPNLKRFFTYVWADKKGKRFTTTDQCTKEYSACSTPLDHLINMKILELWQALSKRFAIQLQDE